MTRRLEIMPTPQGVGPNQTATVNLPIGPTYNTILINAEVVATGLGFPAGTYINPSIFKDLRLVVNGTNRIEIAVTDLVKLNDYYGVPTQPGVLALHLSQPWTRTILGEENTAYGTATGVSSLTLEIDLGPSFTSAYKLSVSAVQSEPKPYGSHLSIQRFSEDMSLVGTKEIANIPIGAYSMMAMHLTTAAVNEVEVLANNTQIHRSKKVLRDGYLRMKDRFPQNDMTHIDFMLENRLGESLPMALQSFRTKLDVTEQDQTFKIYAVSIQGITQA